MYSSSSLTDPTGSRPIAEGVAWVQGAALGSVATTVAVIAVAAIGLMMFAGRLELRRGITVVLGCFILFGAASIAAELTGLDRADGLQGSVAASDPSPLASQLPASAPPPAAYDPYAGASVPQARQQ
jgi:type IV secretory pathway VirB2 component (pilin)